MRDDLGTALGSAVGIVAAQMVGFTVAPHPFVVEVRLVAGDADHGLNRRRHAHGFQHVERAHRVDFDGVGGVVVRSAHKCLCRQMKDDLRLELPHGFDKRLAVAHVAPAVADTPAKADHVEMRRTSRHGVRKTGDFRAHLEQPRRQPRTLESGVPGDEHPAAFIDMTKHRLSLGENASGGQRATALWTPVRGNDSPRAPSAPPHPAQACACTGYGGSVGVGHPFSG